MSRSGQGWSGVSTGRALDNEVQDSATKGAGTGDGQEGLRNGIWNPEENQWPESLLVETAGMVPFSPCKGQFKPPQVPSVCGPPWGPQISRANTAFWLQFCLGPEGTQNVQWEEIWITKICLTPPHVVTKALAAFLSCRSTSNLPGKSNTQCGYYCFF